MSKQEHLLTIVGEESSELSEVLLQAAQICNRLNIRTSKALRFGLEEIQPGQELSNAERIVKEYTDLVATLEILETAGVIDLSIQAIEKVAKRQKIERFLSYSETCGTLHAAEV